jgi:hypothetical protein
MSATASTASTAVRTPAPLIWPERDVHSLTSVELDPQLPKNVEPLLPQLRRLAALGDALRALQAIDGTFVDDEHAGTLARASAKLMEEIAESGAVSLEQVEILRRRAGALAELRHDQQIAHDEAALSTPQNLTVIAGPMCTFRNKTRTPLHSMLACTAHRRGDELIAALDASSREALEEVNRLCGTEDVSVGGVFAMQVTDLITMGGESNAFPKHFAYFLPEDEGAGYGEVFNKTILFRNVYGLRYEQISMPLGAALLKGHKPAGDVDVRDVLITWMRGHDIAHAVQTPRAGKLGPKDVGHEPWYSLQEAIADAFGSAMAFTPTWLAHARCSLDDMVAVYLAEALHYLRRGPWNWGDAGAGCVELSFLAENGFIEVDAEGAIAWETERVVAGMLEMCATLEREVVSSHDAATVQAILDRYGWREDSVLAPTLRKIRVELGGVPTSIAYL